MEDFVPGLALKQNQKVSRKSPIVFAYQNKNNEMKRKGSIH